MTTPTEKKLFKSVFLQLIIINRLIKDWEKLMNEVEDLNQYYIQLYNFLGDAHAHHGLCNYTEYNYTDLKGNMYYNLLEIHKKLFMYTTKSTDYICTTANQIQYFTMFSSVTRKRYLLATMATRLMVLYDIKTDLKKKKHERISLQYSGRNKA